MKSDRTKSIKKRTKMQIPAIILLISLIGLGGSRFVIAWFHNPTHIDPNILHVMNYIILVSLIGYISLEVWYKKTKKRWL